MGSKSKAAGNAAGAAGGIFAKGAGKLFRVGKGDRVIRLDPKKIDANQRKIWRDKRPSNVPGENSTVNSRKLDLNDRSKLSPSDREMVDAVENTRRQLGDKSGINYASIRYLDTDGKERILVTSSDGVHSERMGGNYLLDRIPPENIRAVYTERSPCNTHASYCDEWMKRHIPGADVSHSINWGIDGNTKADGNREHRKYRNAL